MKKFKIYLKDTEHARVQEVELAGEDTRFVWKTNPDTGYEYFREGKKTKTHEYHDKWEDAHSALLASAKSKTAYARSKLALAEAFENEVRVLALTRKIQTEDNECETNALTQS